MKKSKSKLDDFEQNPKAGWTMADIETLAKQEGLDVRKPKRGSHYAVVSPHMRDVLTVPHARPIKVVYIKLLVSYARAHQEAARISKEAK